MGLLSEFREFATKGNVIDLAVGVIIGGAFAKITNSLVEDVIMPVIGKIMGGGLDFSNLFIVLGDVPAGTPMTYVALKEAGVGVLAYGNFLTVLINFIILAFIIFMMIKVMNNLRKKQEVADTIKEVGPSEEILLLREISAKLDKR